MQPQTIYLIGDSFAIADYGFNDSAATVPIVSAGRVLQETLRVPVINTGVGGASTSTIKNTFTTLAASSSTARAAIVICSAGTNDLNQATPSTITGYINEILAVLTSYPKRFILYGPFAGTTFTAQQKTNIEGIRAAFEAAFPDNWIDMSDFCTAEDNVIDEEFRRFNSAGVRDTLHGGNEFYEAVAARAQALITGGSWGYKAKLRTLRYDVASGGLTLFFKDGNFQTKTTSTYAALSGTDQTRLNNILAVANALRPDGTTLRLDISGAYRDTTRTFSGVGYATADASGGMVAVPRFLSSVATDCANLFASLEA